MVQIGTYRLVLSSVTRYSPNADKTSILFWTGQAYSDMDFTPDVNMSLAARQLATAEALEQLDRHFRDR